MLREARMPFTTPYVALNVRGLPALYIQNPENVHMFRNNKDPSPQKQDLILTIRVYR